MGDQTPTAKAEQVTFVMEGGDEQTHEIAGADLSISTDFDTDNVRVPEDMPQGEFSGSFEVEVETKPVECPDCSVVNHVPTGFLLVLSTDGPVPCSVCGYPLL